jgi:hypothetical protein
MIHVVGETLDIFTDIVNLAGQKIEKYRSTVKLELLEEVEKHYAANTLDWMYDRDRLIAVVRYNILNDGRVADILDLIIDDPTRGRKIIKYFVARGWMRFPSLRFIRFERDYKEQDRGTRMYRIERFLRR